MASETSTQDDKEPGPVRVVSTIIGDVVGSREVADRGRLHHRLTEILAAINQRFTPPVPLRITVGDEYQGGFASLGDAIRATLLLRVELLPTYDVRHGIGRGAVDLLQAEPRVEDGPGWWAARAAIAEVEEAQRRPRERWRRTSFREATSGDGGGGETAGAIRAALVLRDHLVGALPSRSVSVLRDLLAGHTQEEIAMALGISASAVSQRVRTGGIASILIADAEWDPASAALGSGRTRSPVSQTGAPQ